MPYLVHFFCLLKCHLGTFTQQKHQATAYTESRFESFKDSPLYQILTRGI